ncbi:DUF4755 domain-containing protein [Klebsiella oxytoca]|uniref:DUF4755 domain-containing protein n=1 Tax=Klebsiella oxytoca TaxID=571 RepID=UPI000649AD44|nr:DUF4755 domain-containing protein [Klebsiella oxytoca]AKL05319.1 hypothetical protein AB184_08690 [Klebsiella oxytoca]AKL22242.1 hypothetical protein AB181_08940 [Klebsiella oxytoca]APB42881.1 DUF4755 domain-containing protein [Klebsiella oxytoca]EKU2838390.1 DUF4755 domain-containing protein [Klebsiella oxytoca]EKU7502671.1 DUF4755 domain-containing protein [Klebsiella oxytoca]
MEAVGIIFLVVIFIIILTFSDIQKKKHYNSFIEVLDGDILSYQCQRTGIVIDTKQRTIRFFDKERDKTYSYDNIREINYTLSEGGKFYGNGTLKGMNNAAIANWREQLSANQRSGLNILTDDIKNPMWKINVPLKNKTTSNQELCERWLLVFNRYVF